MSEPITREIKFVTTQRILSDREPVSGFPMRSWKVEVLMDEPGTGTEITPPFIERVVFKLHPTFQNPNRTLKRPPFKLQEEGWGEFEMHIVVHYTDGGGSQTIGHDLNFQQERYEKKHTLTFKNPKPNLLRTLNARHQSPSSKSEYENGHGTATGSVSGTPRPTGASAAPKRSATESDQKKKKLKVRSVDMDRLANGLQKLGEEDLLQIVSLVNDQKTDDMYVKNDVEEGEFHIDLHTLSDQLLSDMMRIVEAALK